MADLIEIHQNNRILPQFFNQSEQEQAQDFQKTEINLAKRTALYIFSLRTVRHILK